MILLDSTLRKIQIVLSAAKATSDCAWISAYSDMVSVVASVPVVDGGNSSNGTTNGTTAVDVVVAPGSSAKRRLLDFKLVNTDTAPITVTLNYNDNGTLLALWSGMLNVGDVLQYNTSKDFTVTDSNGNIKTVQGAPSFNGLAMPGRLTPSSTLAVPTSDIVGATSVYYLPAPKAVGYYRPVYNGSSFAGYSITSSGLTLTLNTSNHLSGKLYDVFAIYSGGSLILVSGPAWTSTTARSTAITQSVGNIWTNSTLMTAYNGATSYSVAANQGTYLGTIYLTANGQTTIRFGMAGAAGGSAPFCGIWNAYNQVQGAFYNYDSNGSWTYSTAATRQRDGNANNQFSFVQGLVGCAVYASVGFAGDTSVAGATFIASLNLDALTLPTASGMRNAAVQNASGYLVNMTITAAVQPAPGYHYIAELETGAGGAGTTTWAGATAVGAGQYLFWY